MKFYLGTHQPGWLARDLGVPLLVSHRRLAGRRTLPRATTGWALDSGGFTELSLHGHWRTDATAYAVAVRRYATEIGHLDWAAPQDWMTEPHVLARTGLSLHTHQHRTVTNYLRLRDLAPDLPIIPVLQGQSADDYHRCADLYERHGIDLAALPLVGVGSVCRRQHTADVERIMRSLAARALRLHGFGVKLTGLARYADTITSSDSASWSLTGRYTTGCTPTHRSESNCLRFALAWHNRVLQTLTPDTDPREPQPDPSRGHHEHPTTRPRTPTPSHPADTRPADHRPATGPHPPTGNPRTGRTCRPGRRPERPATRHR
ncbi:DUF7221 family queuine tRNA-ribosyltransferase-like protein [Saccharothrix texasensis]|uniref:DeoxyPurine in DNA protein A domain-containing protein n=1 Tax=Saccharothrix texasensis TaxID=103734 RepID=A0A3N1H485_9PSEU|nr:hypothetical protein [Saccharothrix texasensis]ROP37343.1 hypothetical protein EDD40_2650 [Saccharothrix texasensis]